MFKTVISLFRGRYSPGLLSALRVAGFIDEDRREAALSLDLAERALGAAVSANAKELRRVASLDRRIAQLEQRASQELGEGRIPAAAETAGRIASLERLRITACETQKGLASEVRRLKRDVAAARDRLADWERDQRIAHLVAVAERLRERPAGRARNEQLAETEAALARLRANQARSEAAASAREALNNAAVSMDIAGVLAAAGFGARPQPTAEDVLLRLRTRAAALRLVG